jgi:hypothetical protein
LDKIDKVAWLHRDAFGRLTSILGDAVTTGCLGSIERTVRALDERSG